MSGHFDPQRVEEAAAKEKAAASSSNVINLMDALQKSAARPGAYTDKSGTRVS
jgi:non-homologous end joining protein Ku